MSPSGLDFTPASEPGLQVLVRRMADSGLSGLIPNAKGSHSAFAWGGVFATRTSPITLLEC